MWWQERLIPRQAEVGLLDEGDPVALAQAEEAARRTRELLATRGWCLWKCAVLSDDIISIVRGELSEEAEGKLMDYLVAAGVTEGGLVYTEVELEELCQDDVSETNLRLIHEAKKSAGAVVISVGDAERGTHAS